MLNHIVLFAAKDGQNEELENTLEEFSNDIAAAGDVVDSVNWGVNTNASGLQRGITHGCTAVIPDGQFDAYWNHPAHQRLLGALDELCEHRFAVDYSI